MKYKSLFIAAIISAMSLPALAADRPAPPEGQAPGHECHQPTGKPGEGRPDFKGREGEGKGKRGEMHQLMKERMDLVKKYLDKLPDADQKALKAEMEALHDKYGIKPHPRHDGKTLDSGKDAKEVKEVVKTAPKAA